MALNKDIIKRWHNSELLLLGGSAGSFKLIFRIVKNLVLGQGKAIVVVIHRKKNFFSEIEKLFAENTRMSLREITDKDIIKQDTVYIVPANYHALVEKERTFSLDVSEPVWYSRPSIDVTFESAAEAYGQRCTAILLSGANQDGAAGLLKLRKAGALTITQNPKEAEMTEMPQSALDLDAAEYTLSNNDIFELLQLTKE